MQRKNAASQLTTCFSMVLLALVRRQWQRSLRMKWVLIFGLRLDRQLSVQEISRVSLLTLLMAMCFLSMKSIDLVARSKKYFIVPWRTLSSILLSVKARLLAVYDSIYRNLLLLAQRHEQAHWPRHFETVLDLFIDWSFIPQMKLGELLHELHRFWRARFMTRRQVCFRRELD